MNKDIKAFITYITGIWGLLAGITALFPLADVLLNVIPLPVDPYEKSTAPIAIPITTMVSVFILFYSFVQRDKINVIMTKRAMLFFTLGLISLIVFFLLKQFQYDLRTWLFPKLDSTADYTLMLVGIVPFYVAFFSFITRAFVILAIIEFKQKGNHS
jgi:hypothetical protein